MPWTGESFHKHNAGFSDAQSSHAARIANAILARGAPEGTAIATANKLVEHPKRADGGPVPLAFGGTPGFPSGIRPPHLMGGRPDPMKPPHFGMPGGNSAPHVGGAPGAMRIGVPRPGFDMGGTMGISPSQAEPWWSREEARGEDQVHPGGLVASPTSGRADHVPTAVAANSYVLPADIVSGLGEGNSMAGSAVVDKWMHSLPYGIEGTQARSRGPGMPHPEARPPTPRVDGQPYAAGGLPGFREGRVPHGPGNSTVPVRLSGGEYVINPEYVLAIGRKFGGDMDFGHDALDAFVLKLRKQLKKDIAALPPPKRD